MLRIAFLFRIAFPAYDEGVGGGSRRVRIRIENMVISYCDDAIQASGLAALACNRLVLLVLKVATISLFRLRTEVVVCTNMYFVVINDARWLVCSLLSHRSVWHLKVL